MADPTAHDARHSAGDRLTRYVFWILGGFAGIILAALMAVTVIDVVGRYLFNAPLPGSFEITKVMMAALIFAALPAVSRFEQHITIDLLDGITPKGMVRFRQVTINPGVRRRTGDPVLAAGGLRRSNCGVRRCDRVSAATACAGGVLHEHLQWDRRAGTVRERVALFDGGSQTGRTAHPAHRQRTPRLMRPTAGTTQRVKRSR